MNNEDIFLELMRHMSIDLKSFSLTCKLAHYTYQNNKNTLLQYKNYRFSPFQHALINTLATKTKEPYLLHTYNNKGKKSAIIIFALLYNRKINIITGKKEYEKWYNEYIQVAEDKSLLIFDKINYKNYNILITTEMKKQHDLYFFYKTDYPYHHCENYIYIDKYGIAPKIKHIYYPHVVTSNVVHLICDNNEKGLNDLFNSVHFHHVGPYIVLGNKVHHQPYMIHYMQEHTKKIRPNTFYFINYDKFITNQMNYNQFVTFILLWPESITTMLLSQINEKIKSYNYKNIVKIHYNTEGIFVEKAIIHTNKNYAQYGVQLTSFPINTNKYIQIINKLLLLHGDKLHEVPDDYFVLIMYVCKDDLKTVMGMIHNYINKNK